MLKVFLLRLGVGGGRIFLKIFKDKGVFSIKEFFLSGVGCLRVGGGGGIKNFQR